ncbi:MAG TPA: metallophosphoesterase family protein, partial [Polyangiaceae bacterium]|nr:metallophosphoesterase family protein [Polyangiaceae bacterium]
MLRSRLLLGLVPAILVSCSGGKSSSAPPLPGDDAGGDDGGGGSSLTYSPQGCLYTYTPPGVLGFTDLALDSTTAPVDATNGVPQRVRVGLGGGTTKGQPGYADPTTTAAFTWETAESDQAAEVKMGTDPGSLTDVHTGYTWTTPKELSASDVYMHEVHVCGLTADTTYYYQVGGGPAGAQVWSATQTFTTVPATGNVTVGVFGDARDTVGTWQAVNQRMRDAGVAMALIDGDIVDSGTIESLYTTWLDAIWHDPNDATKFLTLGQIPMVPVNGNHENDSSISFANWATPGDGAYAETYGSFDVGSAHFMMIDDQQIAESIETGGASTEAQAQLAWIDQDLAAANADRKNHPFIVAMGHRGLFSTSNHAADADVLAARGALAPIY